MTAQAIINIVQAKKRYAEFEEYKYNLSECNYHWEFGEKIYEIIYKDSVEKWMKYGGLPLKNSDERFELMGYPLTINYHDKEMIKLWREVG